MARKPASSTPDSAAAEIVGLYERHASAWDAVRRRSRFAERKWIDRFADLLPAGGAVLDLGCGSGEPIGRHLAGSGFAVTGVDGSPPLIELCRTRMPAQTWLVGDMRDVALDRRFDGLIAWHSFFHLTREDQRRMFDVFAAHAATAAALMFTSGPQDGEALGRFEGESLYHASLAPEEYRALLAARGFEVVDFVAEDPESNGDTVWLAKRMEGAE
jgi:SAM-dependent methyltransferase